VWFVELLRDEPEIKTSLVWMASYPAKPLSKYFGITMFAARADLGAATDWVPSGIGPLDL
jgi:hypothetical protein